MVINITWEFPPRQENRNMCISKSKDSVHEVTKSISLVFLNLKDTITRTEEKTVWNKKNKLCFYSHNNYPLYLVLGMKIGYD